MSFVFQANVMDLENCEDNVTMSSFPLHCTNELFCGPNLTFFGGNWKLRVTSCSTVLAIP
jgi:hypothetical protein